MWLLGGYKGRHIEARIGELIGQEEAAAFFRKWRDAFFTEADVARVKQLGFNSIRLAMNARLLMPEGQNNFDELEFGRLHKLVEWCGKLWPIYQRLRTEIRAVDTVHALMLSGHRTSGRDRSCQSQHPGFRSPQRYP